MQLLTTDFKIRQANFFVDNISTEDVFLFAGQVLPYANSADETVENTEQQTFYDVHSEMIFGKYVTEADYSVMIPYVPWETGTVYTEYDHEEVLEGTSFYVCTLESSAYSVFKCLDNNGGAASTDMPLLSETDPTDEYYQTSDGYVWKLMYTFSSATYDKFATDEYIPFVANVEVSNNAVSGAIDIVKVSEPGQGYSNYAEGDITSVAVGGDAKKFYIQSSANTNLSANTGFYSNSAFYISSGPGAGQLEKIVDYGTEGNNRYVVIETAFSTSPTTASSFKISPNVTLDGDGSGFKGRVVVDESNDSLDYVQVINRGSGYSYATANIGANTAAINSSSFSSGDLRAIIPPYGGHGFDQQQELFGHYVCVSEQFAGSELPTANNDYRTIGLMQNPEFRSAELELNTISGITIGTVLTQANSGATGTVESIDVGNTIVTVNAVSGVFDGANVSDGNTSYSVSTIVDNNDLFDQRLKLNLTITSGTAFEQDELVIQESTLAQGYVHEYSNNTLYIVQTEGTFSVSAVNEVVGQDTSTRAVINSIVQPDAVKYSGEILYVENVDPITRYDSQSETIKLVIGF